jgi:hypothetical protein
MARIDGGSNSYELQELCELGSASSVEANANLLCDLQEVYAETATEFG